jgi:hypothetical protein
MQTSPGTWIRWHQRHGEDVAATCRHFGISRATLYRWLARSRQDPHAPLRRRSRRPKSPRAPGWTVRQLLAVAVLANTHPGWGRVRVWQALSLTDRHGLSEATVGRLLRVLRTDCPFCGVLRPGLQLIYSRQGHIIVLPPRGPTGHSQVGCNWLVRSGVLASDVLEQRMSLKALRQHVKHLLQGSKRPLTPAQVRLRSREQTREQFERLMADEETREVLEEAMRLIAQRSGERDADD